MHSSFHFARTKFLISFSLASFVSMSKAMWLCSLDTGSILGKGLVRRAAADVCSSTITGEYWKIVSTTIPLIRQRTPNHTNVLPWSKKTIYD